MEFKMNGLELCIRAAINGGNSILDYKPLKTKTKEDYHAIVSSADYKSQKAILSILRQDRNSLFITEEHVRDRYFRERLVGGELDCLKDSRVYIIDELDGSSSFKIGHYEWSISIGLIENLEHEAGAVFAPHIKKGILFYASRGGGAFIRENKKDRKLKISKRKLRNSYIIFGVDCFLKKYPK